METRRAVDLYTNKLVPLKDNKAKVALEFDRHLRDEGDLGDISKVKIDGIMP